MIYEAKVFYKEKVQGEAWVEVEASSKKEAFKKIEEGNYEWIDCSQADGTDLELIYSDMWEIKESE